MKLLSFLGQTPSDALKKAVRSCGEEAIVVSTKKISSKTKNSIEMHEVIVSVDQSDEKIKVVDSPVRENKQHISTEKIFKNSLNIEQQEEMRSLRKSIRGMQEAIFQMQSTLWNTNRSNNIDDLAIPVEFSDIYKLFVDNDMPKGITYKIMKFTIKRLPAYIKDKPKKVNHFFRLILRRMLSIKHEKPLDKDKTKIMIFVGPTGVGKTTTLAKIAARYLYKTQNATKIGLITLDSFRVAAAEQLNTYAKIMQLPIQMVKDPKELPNAIKRLGEPNLVLIDTPGSSQYDRKMLELTKQYYDTNPDLKIETNLILPTNIKFTDLEEIYNEFSILDIDNIIFTKLDETKSFGNIISFVHSIKKPLTYFSIGQNVPDDLIVSDDDYLIDCFFNQGIKKDKTSK